MDQIKVVQKKCNGCKTTKLANEFGIDRENKKTGLKTYCKQCIKIRNNELYQRKKIINEAHKEAINECINKINSK